MSSVVEKLKEEALPRDGDKILRAGRNRVATTKEVVRKTREARENGEGTRRGEGTGE